MESVECTDMTKPTVNLCDVGLECWRGVDFIVGPTRQIHGVVHCAGEVESGGYRCYVR